MPTRFLGVCFEEICCRPREQDFPVKWFKFIYPSSKPRMTKTSTCTPVHVAYSPLSSMNHEWTINLHDGYTSFNALMPVEYIPPSIPTLCSLMSTMFHFHVDSLHSTQDTQHNLSSLASPKGKWQVLSVGLFFQETHIQHMFWWPYTCKDQSSNFSVNL